MVQCKIALHEMRSTEDKSLDGSRPSPSSIPICPPQIQYLPLPLFDYQILRPCNPAASVTSVSEVYSSDPPCREMSGSTATEILQSSLSILVNFATNGYILAALALIHLLRNKYAQGLNAVPGPFLAGFSSLWRLVDVWGGSAQWTVIRLHRELGPLVRTGPRHVSVSDPKAINTIYGVNPRFLKVRPLV